MALPSKLKGFNLFHNGENFVGKIAEVKHSLESLRELKVSYDVILDGTRYRGSPLILQGISDNPITRGVEATLAEERITLVRNAPYLFHVLDVATFAAGAYPTFARAQAEYYRRFVERAGDPRIWLSATSMPVSRTRTN
ncbi:hypothetical protein [Burkholderia multivorans]|uniref:hypothetical protein n=1 Tax=Burkholderia multivorans TaxID=87883 RepID=UPI0020195676|nr:hypothetical protein [Burkholderia multivorans]MCL4627698.1 hypothetical protein [Burkholderia multivorans]MCO1390805.1 hypothetical protein [Burkholderia multivorans]MDN7431630.1 hypothetical protein [Burkholderia multivorans]UQO13069.1 hypothetical protein L0Z40_21260 [Burkholderia multivorans]UQO55307.1 hypothetical protein L0Z30_05425 [Burkholderia multivorans]